MGSPWASGRLRGSGKAKLLFGVMYEDAAVDERVLGRCERIFAIAASGDTALRLATSDRHVTAVDVNRAQVAYLQGRLAGETRRPGVADRLLRVARSLAPLAGWTHERVERFLRLTNADAQRETFDRQLDTRRFRAVVDAGLAPATLLRAYRPEFVGFLPAPFGPLLRESLRRGILTHPNRHNVYARLLFVGEPPPADRAPPGSVEVVPAEAAAYLTDSISCSARGC